MGRIRVVAGAAVACLLALSGCTVSVVDLGEVWPEVEQMQLSIAGVTIKLRRAGGVSGPVPVLRLGENPIMATAFRQYYGGQERMIQAPRFALQVLPSLGTPVQYVVDSANAFGGILVATETTNSGFLRVQLFEPATGRIHFGPAMFGVAIIDH